VTSMLEVHRVKHSTNAGSEEALVTVLSSVLSDFTIADARLERVSQQQHQMMSIDTAFRGHDNKRDFLIIYWHVHVRQSATSLPGHCAGRPVTLAQNNSRVPRRCQILRNLSTKLQAILTRAPAGLHRLYSP